MEQDVRFCMTPDGVRIAYATAGKGPPLVKTANWLNHLEHDWTSPVWRHFMEAFAEDHLLVRYDERGNGLSDWNAEELSFEAFVRDPETVVDTVGLDRFPLLGISQGCAVSVVYAVRHPERVTRLVLYGGYAQGWAARGRPEEIERFEALLTLIRSGWGQDNPAFRQIWATLYLPEGTPEQIRSYSELQRITASPENAVRLSRTLSMIDVKEYLGRVGVPTLVLHSTSDAVVPFGAGRHLAASIPGAKLVALESRNHLLLEHEPAWRRFVTEVRAFLGAREPAPLRSPGGLGPGRKLAHYEILARIGEGGMGDVYRARDTKLERDVALKVLPRELAEDRERQVRFRREARALAALKHPNIVTVYSVEYADAWDFLTMELVEGESLADRIQKGSLPPAEFLAVAIPLADAIGTAHERGILHRDLKPANVMLDRSGAVKVLDFGLARFQAGEGSVTSVTVEAGTTGQVLLGTLPYMSPEQVEARPVDSRSDVFSLGVVLFEMAVGRRPFRGERPVDIALAILRHEPPPVDVIAPGYPADIARIVSRCLEKDPESRMPSAAVVRDRLRALE